MKSSLSEGALLERGAAAEDTAAEQLPVQLQALNINNSDQPARSIYGHSTFSVGQRVSVKERSYDDCLMVHALADLQCDEKQIKKWQGKVGVVYNYNRQTHGVDVVFYETALRPGQSCQQAAANVTQIGATMHAVLLQDQSGPDAVHFGSDDLATVNPFPFSLDSLPHALPHVHDMCGKAVYVNSCCAQNVHVSVIGSDNNDGLSVMSAAFVPSRVLLPVYTFVLDSSRLNPDGDDLFSDPDAPPPERTAKVVNLARLDNPNMSALSRLAASRLTCPSRLLVGVPRAVTTADWTRLHTAALTDDPNTIKQFKLLWPTLVDNELPASVEGSASMTALMAAAHAGCTRAVFLLKGTEQRSTLKLLRPRSTDGVTAVHLAASADRTDTLNVMLGLLKAHIDRHPADAPSITQSLSTSAGVTLLQVALQSQATGCIRLLMNAPALHIWQPQSQPPPVVPLPLSTTTTTTTTPSSTTAAAAAAANRSFDRGIRPTPLPPLTNNNNNAAAANSLPGWSLPAPSQIRAPGAPEVLFGGYSAVSAALPTSGEQGRASSSSGLSVVQFGSAFSHSASTASFAQQPHTTLSRMKHLPPTATAAAAAGSERPATAFGMSASEPLIRPPLHSMLRPAATNTGARPPAASSEQQQLSDVLECQICMDCRRETVFHCGHTACRACSERMTHCHVCREPIKQRIPLFL